MILFRKKRLFFLLLGLLILFLVNGCQRNPVQSENPVYSVTPGLEPTEFLEPTVSAQPTQKPLSDQLEDMESKVTATLVPEDDAGEEAEQLHKHRFEGNQCTDCLGELVMLRTTMHENTYLSGFLGSTNKNDGVIRSKILRIIFCDYKDTEGHYFSDLNCWDVSQAQDESIMAWYVSYAPNQYYDVYVAPAKENVIIQAHTDASYLFANLESQVAYATEIIGLEKVEFGQTINMSHMFSGTKLAKDFVFHADTTKVTDVSYMYQADRREPIEEGITFGEEVDFSNVIKADGMFLNQSELKEITLPKGLNLLAPDMFYGCSKLRSVELPEGIRQIGDRAFQFCTRLGEIVFPESVEEIGKEAFYQCENLLAITLPDHLVRIGDFAFGYCKNLKYITWKGIVYTEPEAFHTVLRETGVAENIVWQ